MTDSETAIIADGLGKQYRIGMRLDSSPTLRDSMVRAAKRPLQRLRALARGEAMARSEENFWALRDVSFEVKRGEVLGIVGRNGSGKSTLLKILSRVTEPTHGWAQVHGRVGSMLEVGTGFHPELTGRENLFLNGSILGMTRAETRRKFDEIVEFSGVADFLDTPVKYFSSGMYLRLAFAVAAHLEPEILMVDEVLAVGDAGFQRKCLAKMEEVSRQGRTVLFVSHNVGLVQSLCHRALWLGKGAVQSDGPAPEVVRAYLQGLEAAVSADLLERTERGGRGSSRLARIDIRGGDGRRADTLATGHSAQFAFHVTAALPYLSCCFTIYDECGHPVTYFDSAVHGAVDSRNPSCQSTFLCQLDELLLIPGRYRINAALMLNGELQDHVEGASFFQVEQGTLRGRPVSGGAGYGNVSLPHCWTAPH